MIRNGKANICLRCYAQRCADNLQRSPTQEDVDFWSSLQQVPQMFGGPQIDCHYCCTTTGENQKWIPISEREIMVDDQSDLLRL